MNNNIPHDFSPDDDTEDMDPREYYVPSDDYGIPVWEDLDLPTIVPQEEPAQDCRLTPEKVFHPGRARPNTES